MVNAIAAARVTEPRAIRVTTPSILGVGQKRAALRRVPDKSSFFSSPLSAEVPPRQRARLWRTGVRGSRPTENSEIAFATWPGRSAQRNNIGAQVGYNRPALVTSGIGGAQFLCKWEGKPGPRIARSIVQIVRLPTPNLRAISSPDSPAISNFSISTTCSLDKFVSVCCERTTAIDVLFDFATTRAACILGTSIFNQLPFPPEVPPALECSANCAELSPQSLCQPREDPAPPLGKHRRTDCHLRVAQYAAVSPHLPQHSRPARVCRRLRRRHRLMVESETGFRGSDFASSFATQRR
jgi:hypothetical protein